MCSGHGVVYGEMSHTRRGGGGGGRGGARFVMGSGL